MNLEIKDYFERLYKTAGGAEVSSDTHESSIKITFKFYTEYDQLEFLKIVTQDQYLESFILEHDLYFSTALVKYQGAYYLDIFMEKNSNYSQNEMFKYKTFKGSYNLFNEYFIMN